MPSTEISLLLRNLVQAYDAKAWHGTNLRGSLRGLDLDDLCFRPGPGRHDIWELALHCAYWKYAVRRRLTGEKRGSFPLKGSNFFPRPQGETTVAAWRSDLKLLDECHSALCAVVAELPTRRLGQRLRGSEYTVVDTVLGIAAHDLYHAGQIQLLKRLARSGPSS